MGKKIKKLRLAELPAWALSLLTFFATIGIWVLFDYIQLPKPIDSDTTLLVFYILSLTTASFIICWRHPKSVWYTPFICNAMIIFILIFILIDLPSNPDIKGFIYLSCCVIFSVVGAFVGAKIGRRKINQTDNG